MNDRGYYLDLKMLLLLFNKMLWFPEPWLPQSCSGQLKAQIRKYSGKDAMFLGGTVKWHMALLTGSRRWYVVGCVQISI